MRRMLIGLFLVVALALPMVVLAHSQSMREVVVLAVNDVYRIEGIGGGPVGGLELVRALRQQLEKDHPDLLFLHAGDFLFPSLVSEWTKGAHMVEMMNLLDGASGTFDPRMLVVFGNH